VTTTTAPTTDHRRRVHFADLLLVPALAGAWLAAGGDDLARPVGALALADPDAPDEPAAVVLSPAGVPDTLAPDCAGVICRVAPETDPGVPVAVLAPGAPWGPLIAQLVALLDGAPARDAARDALHAPLVAGRGFAGLAEVAEALLGMPVAILDEYLDTLGSAGLSDRDGEALAAAVEASRGHGPVSLLGPFMDQDLPGITRRLTSGPDGATGVLALWSPPPLSAAREDVLAELIEAVGVERARERVVADTEARLRGDLMEELLAGETLSRESLVRRARHLGADLGAGAVAVLGVVQDPHSEGRTVNDPRLARRLLQHARVTIDQHVAARALVDWRDGRLMVLLPPPSPPGEEGAPGRAAVEAEARALAGRMLATMSQTVPGLTLTLALSRYTAEPERLGSALEEASLALAIGERLGRAGQVVTFEETGTYKLLFQIFTDRPEEIAAFYDQTIGPLARYDEQYQTELVTTLSTYLGHDGSLAATAGTLYTHRHTVRYRLDRIAELSGLDISRTDDREKLSLGLKAARLLRRLV